MRETLQTKKEDGMTKDELEAELTKLREDQLQILSFIVHDLKSPLNRIYALGQLLQLETSVNPEQKAYLDKISIVISDTLLMVHNINDYRSLMYRGLEKSIAPLSLKVILGRLIHQIRSHAEKKDIRFEATYDESIVFETDLYLIQRILENLLSNAVKFSASGKQVRLSVNEHEGKIRFAISDEARGFKAGEPGKLFQKFTRLSATPTAGESNTGLGLFIASQFAGMIGGTIELDNQEGDGCTFTLDVPAAGYSKR